MKEEEEEEEEEDDAEEQERPIDPTAIDASDDESSGGGEDDALSDSAYLPSTYSSTPLSPREKKDVAFTEASAPTEKGKTDQSVVAAIDDDIDVVALDDLDCDAACAHGAPPSHGVRTKLGPIPTCGWHARRIGRAD